MANSERKRTVAFYEIVRPKDSGEVRRMPEIDWQLMLSNLGRISPQQRLYRDTADVYFGEPVEADGKYHLGLARLRDGEIQQIDWQNGHIDHLQLDGDRSVVDTTVACFLQFGNIIGILKSSISAPRPTSVQRWLNAMNTGLDRDIAITPLISMSAYEKLKRAEEVTFLEKRQLGPNFQATPPHGKQHTPVIGIGITAEALRTQEDILRRIKANHRHRFMEFDMCIRH
ncbi:hypothetical protein [Kitasatospora purpeofusca]|uniref:hypothetical protein n=1 Tax=Kitasatospora purpeofusca TaxID=67352 RepID=UPI0036781F33